MTGSAEGCRSDEDGLSTDVDVGGEVVRVLTVDGGDVKPEVVTHVFGPGGEVVRTKRYDYGKYEGHSRLSGILPTVMSMQHEAVVRQLRDEAVRRRPTAGPVLVSVAPSGGGAGEQKQVETSGRGDQKSRVPWDQIVEARRRDGREDASPDELEAEASFRAAQGRLCDGQDEESLPLFAQAVYLKPQDPRYRAGLFGVLSRLRWVR